MLSLKVEPASPSGEPARDVRPDVVWHDNDGRVAAFGWSAGDVHRVCMPGVADYAWSAGDDDVTARPDAAGDAQGVVEGFHRCVLPLALQTRGIQVLHASAVRGPDGVVGLCAR